MVVFKVARFDPDRDEEPHLESYNVPYEKGMRVLDALNYIRATHDSTLAYRWICRAGQCGSCGVRVDGKAVLACQEEVDPAADIVVIEPLPFFPVIKDLVVDLARGYKRLYGCSPYLERTEPYQSPERLSAEETKDIKALRSCIECWCCVASCPVANAVWDDYAGPLPLRKLCELAIDPRDMGGRIEAALNEGLYNCTTCRNCWAVCPEEIEIPEKAIERLRALAVKERKGPLPGHNQLVRSIENYRNPWVMPRARRARWAKRLGMPSHGPLMFYAGCSPSLLLADRLPVSVVRVLRCLNIEPAYLGKDELCCGSPLLKVGEQDKYLELARENIRLMKERGVETIVTTCAGCHKSWKVDYPEMCGDHGIDVVHVTELLWELYQEGVLRFKDLPKNHVRVTYHDPCHLGRGTGLYDAPRNLIRAIPGMILVEGARSRENSQCCGSGGGVKTARPEVALEVGRTRIAQAEECDVSYIITCCPWCEQHLDDASRAAHSSLGTTRDLIEIILETMECENDG